MISFLPLTKELLKEIKCGVFFPQAVLHVQGLRVREAVRRMGGGLRVF